MPKNGKNLNSDLFSLLQSRGFNPTILSSDGKQVPIPEEGDVFQFHFRKAGKDYGTISISIDGLHKLVVYFSEEVANSPKDRDGESWYDILRQLKQFAHRRQLSFDLKNMDKLKFDMAKRRSVSLSEGYYPLSKKASWSDSVPTVKMIIQHSRTMHEGEARYRSISKIFVENENGERFLLPTTKPGIGRVYARHVAEGGTPYDARGTHITGLVNEYTSMAGFCRATKNATFNESVGDLVNEGLKYYSSLRETLKKLSGKKGYANYFESDTQYVLSEGGDDSLKELFKSSTLDPRIESVMPILSRLQKNISENMSVAQLESWADELVNEALYPDSAAEIEELIDLIGPSSDELAVGPDGLNAKNRLAELLDDDELSADLEHFATHSPDGDSRAIIKKWLSKQPNGVLKALGDKLK